MGCFNDIEVIRDEFREPRDFRMRCCCEMREERRLDRCEVCGRFDRFDDDDFGCGCRRRRRGCCICDIFGFGRRGRFR